MFKKKIFSTVICFGLVFLMQQNCSAQTKTKDEKKQTEFAQNNEQMFLENESKYNFAETVEKLTAEIEKKTWKVLVVHDLQETLKKKGTDVLPIKVFALCHPKHASKILLKDDERIVSSLMPCRISIYEKSDGKSYISRMNTGVLAKSIGGIVEEVMIASSKDVEEILSSLIVTK
ncbi:MAG: DUF302 domain-containing protein [Flavobacteriaceae bacterium]|nr:DUF302 domain-containing protein [Flavobacteriaceae bacterium]